MDQQTSNASRYEIEPLDDGMTSAEKIMLTASRSIGGIADSAAWYAIALAMRIKATGKSVRDLTVGELVSLNEQLRDEVNRVGGGRVNVHTSGPVNQADIRARQTVLLEQELHEGCAEATIALAHASKAPDKSSRYIDEAQAGLDRARAASNVLCRAKASPK